MKAVGYRRSLPVSDPDCLLDVTLPDPVATGRDLLVQVKAVSVNPVDAKQRKRAEPVDGSVAVLGYDAAGVVVAVGDEVTLFKPGDEVWYAGSIARPGTNSELHLVDERIVGKKPKSLDFARAAALPLTTITAWEMLFDRLRIEKDHDRKDQGQSLLIVGAAGGVGSMLTQLARQLTGLKVIGTASREETQEWVKSLGAHEVIDHRQPLSQELKRVGIESVTHVAALTHTDQHIGEIVECLAPFGNLALIDDPAVFDVKLLKRKALSLHWELMFTRPLYQTADMVRQHELLNETADLVDAGVLRTTFGEHLGEINAANLKRAHALIESNTAKGKMVLEHQS
jgi:zinc-binding alcohol dehydrogenase family protein